MRDHVAVYGNVALLRAFCEHCGSFSLVLKDGKLACCDRKHSGDAPTRIKRIVEPEQLRRAIPQKVRARILEQQDGRCFYCDRLIGSQAYYKGRVVRLRLHLDHLVPHSYNQNDSEDNFVGACHICNSHKSALMFQTVEEAKIYLLNKIARDIALTAAKNITSKDRIRSSALLDADF